MKPFIIILHFGDITVTKKCINSLLHVEPYIEKIILVNNNTESISPREFSTNNIDVLNNNKNLGFGAGVNVGIKYALHNKAKTILLLNNDTIIKKPFLEKLLVDLEKNKNIGIIGPAILFMKNNKIIFDMGGKVNLLTGRTSHDEVEKIQTKQLRQVTYITGAAMLVRKEVFEKMGFFDEDFFLYYEDADFCLRARKAGFEVAVDPTVTVYHLLSKTIGKVSSFAVYHQTRSAVIFGRKYMKSGFQKLAHRIFLVLQTALITLKFPREGLSGWKAIFFT